MSAPLRFAYSHRNRIRTMHGRVSEIALVIGLAAVMAAFDHQYELLPQEPDIEDSCGDKECYLRATDRRRRLVGIAVAGDASEQPHDHAEHQGVNKYE